MITIQNTNENYGWPTEFSGNTLEEAVASMQDSLRSCGPEFANVVVGPDDYQINPWQLVSTCDDSGAILAKRIEDPSFVRVIESHDTKAKAKAALTFWLNEYTSRGVAIGHGCLSVRKSF